MLYEPDRRFSRARSDDSAPDPEQLLEDLAALVDAGLVVPYRDGEGRVRVTPTSALDDSLDV